MLDGFKLPPFVSSEVEKQQELRFRFSTSLETNGSSKVILL